MDPFETLLDSIFPIEFHLIWINRLGFLRRRRQEGNIDSPVLKSGPKLNCGSWPSWWYVYVLSSRLILMLSWEEAWSPSWSSSSCDLSIRIRVVSCVKCINWLRPLFSLESFASFQLICSLLLFSGTKSHLLIHLSIHQKKEMGRRRRRRRRRRNKPIQYLWK